MIKIVCSLCIYKIDRDCKNKQNEINKIKCLHFPDHFTKSTEWSTEVPNLIKPASDLFLNLPSKHLWKCLPLNAPAAPYAQRKLWKLQKNISNLIALDFTVTVNLVCFSFAIRNWGDSDLTHNFYNLLWLPLRFNSLLSAASAMELGIWHTTAYNRPSKPVFTLSYFNKDFPIFFRITMRNRSRPHVLRNFFLLVSESFPKFHRDVIIIIKFASPRLRS